MQKKNNDPQTKKKGRKERVPQIPFSTNIRTNAEMNIEAKFLNCLYEAHKIVPPLKIILKNKQTMKLDKQTMKLEKGSE